MNFTDCSQDFTLVSYLTGSFDYYQYMKLLTNVGCVAKFAEWLLLQQNRALLFYFTTKCSNK